MHMEHFCDALRSDGLLIDEVIADGTIHRTATTKKPRSNSAWYVYFDNPYPIGVWGDWRTGEKKIWRSYEQSALNPKERVREKAVLREIVTQRAEEQKRVYKEAAELAATIWDRTKPLLETFDYLSGKQITSHGLRYYKGSAVVPVYDCQTQELISLQFIDRDSKKRFLRGSKTKGGYFGIGKPKGNILYLCEGYATAATIYKVTGCGVAIAFNAGNLQTVAEGLLKRYPNLQVIIAADNDRFNEHNIGLEKAKRAAESLGCHYILPVFPDEADGTDFNDLFVIAGQEEVARQLGPSPPDTETEKEEPVRYDYQPFPMEVLPDPVRDYALAQARALGVPPALVILPMFTVFSAAIGNSVAIQLKRSWREPATLWTIVVATSGSGKSPAMKAALNPVLKLEKSSLEQFEQEKQEYAERLDQWESLSKKDRVNAPKPIEPVHRRYRIADTTIEALVALHTENPRGLLVARDELSGLIGSFDRYAKGESDMQSFIEMYDGRPISVDRKSGDKKVLSIHRPNISITGTIQPGMLRSRLTSSHFESGFFSRFIICAPPTRQTGWTDADVSQAVEVAYERMVRSLYQIPHQEDPICLILEGEAKEYFKDFVNQSAILRESMPDGALRSAIVKMDATCARIALILHVLDNAEQLRESSSEGKQHFVSADAMGRAITVTNWLREETIRVWHELDFHHMALSKEEQLLAELPEAFTSQQAADMLGKSQRQIQRDIKNLTQKGYIEERQRGVYHKKEAMSRVANVVSDDFPAREQSETTQTTCDTVTRLDEEIRSSDLLNEETEAVFFPDEAPF